jgi:adenine/guanine phosphoribosyltransferase-like PRPP-binding protein
MTCEIGKMETFFRAFDNLSMLVRIMAAKIVEAQAFRDRSFVFSDRLQAGELLGEKLREFVGGKSVIILALPAGGVPVAYAVAKKLTAPWMC